MPELKIEHADARDGADNPANGVGDVVVGAGRMVDAIPPATRGAALGAHPPRKKSLARRCREAPLYLFLFGRRFRGLACTGDNKLQ